MERLLAISERKQQANQPDFVRYLMEKIDWNQRLIMILGHRGVGKTTLILQKMKEVSGMKVYLSLDDFYFEENRLIILIEVLYLLGYRYFYLDETHRYTYWSADLKSIFDTYEDAFFVVSGSSILELKKGTADLSRRAAVYQLAGLSFREFIHMEKGQALPVISLSEILENHAQSSEALTDVLDIPQLFEKYLKYGYYPFFRMGTELYFSRLLEATLLVLEMDIGPFEEISYKTIRSMKKLLYIISESVPFIPNISKLAEKLEMSRNTVLKILDMLQQAQILNLLYQSVHGISFLQKPEKIYLQNPNLAYALSATEPNVGNLRETFFMNQLRVGHQVTLPKFGDFMVDDRYVFEIGGPNKTSQQIKGVPNGYLALDQIKIGSGNKIPLWLFGFLY
jgi:predicted AAA+ superfamily ATPase